jgi:hypothetical protein
MSPADEFEFASTDPDGRYWYLPETPRPAHAATQWLTLRLRLHDFVANTPASHFAIVLRARLGFDAAGRACSISGRGMTFGDTSQAHPAPGNAWAQSPEFGGARGAQVESFWPGGNFLYADAAVLHAGLEDGCWYTIALRVDDDRHVSLAVTPEGAQTQRAQVRDRAGHPVLADATGVLIGLGRGGGETGAWRAELRDLACGWS